MNIHDSSGGVDYTTPNTRPPRPWKRWLTLGGGAVVSVSVLSLIAFTAGYQLGGKPSVSPDEASPAAATTWTCSMHPQVKLPEPGKCPICFMDLIPLAQSPAGSGHPRELTMTVAAMALADIQTAPVRRHFVTNSIEMVGKVAYDETKLATITAWVPGRLNRLYIDYTGITVRKGDHLVEMYSPDLIVAQRQLIQAAKNAVGIGSQRGDSLAAKTLKITEEKLRLLGLTRKQIEEIKQRGTPSDQVTIYAPIGGVVVHRDANEGMTVQTGTRLYTIADLSQVWVYMDAYESDLPWIRYGQEVEFTAESYPGDIFKGRVSFIDPILNERTRTVPIRVNVPNADGRLKPGMFVRGVVKSQLAQGGQVIDASMAGKWVSPHHPEIIRDGPGKCPICGIDLVPAEELGFVQADSGAEPPLVIPASAPLITGKRAVVYVKTTGGNGPTFQGREVLLGARVSPPAGTEMADYAGDYYIVQHGLSAGEEVVVNGNFKIDSALQIAAKPSMMSPAGAGAGALHDHASGSHPQMPDLHAAHGMATLEVPSQFRVTLNPLYQAYLDASEMLARDDLAATRQQLQSLLAAAESAGVGSLDEKGRGRWKTLSDEIIFETHAALDAENRETARDYFEHLSSSITTLVREFGHALEHPIVQFHCPMAFQNKGANWLQAGGQTRNPYFGPAMLACGDVMATFYSQAPLAVPPSFRDQLATLYDRYLALQIKLAGDDVEGARRAADALRGIFAEIDDGGLDERTRQSWLLARKQMSAALEGDQDAGLAQLRARFEPLSLTMLGVVENFGHSRPQPLYKAFCPMAFDNQGATWLQAGEAIANPYFGAKMLRCGSIKRSYEPAGGNHDVIDSDDSDHEHQREGV